MKGYFISSTKIDDILSNQITHLSYNEFLKQLHSLYNNIFYIVNYRED